MACGVRRGLSMVEVVIATALIGIVVVGGLNAVGGSARAALVTSDRAAAAAIADAFLAEMMSMPAFVDAGPGRESGEVWTDRAAWDDVNDFDILVLSPPSDAAGVAYPGGTGMTVFTNVGYTDPANPTVTRTQESDAVLLIVSVRRGTAVLVERRAVRTRAGEGVR